jgi:hypothetical protein
MRSEAVYEPIMYLGIEDDSVCVHDRRRPELHTARFRRVRAKHALLTGQSLWLTTGMADWHVP